jgi:GT2 family glycosyltransferase
MKWYFSLSEASIDRPDHGWRGLVRTAVVSARSNTNLHPYMLYDGDESDFLAELRGLGVTVIRHKVTFHEALASRGPSYLPIALGAFLRVELPLIETEDEFVLYTDCDVVFRRHPEIGLRPKYFAAAPETSKVDYRNNMNSGVMLMNVPAMRERLPELRQFIIDHLHDGWPGCDQENLRRFYAGEWDKLPLEHNWKPYWGFNQDATIMHWHGPKPMMIRKLLRDPELSTGADWRRLFNMAPEAYEKWLAEWDVIAAQTNRRVVGHLDRLDTTFVGGWALFEDDAMRPVEFTVMIDGNPAAVVVCSGDRKDLEPYGARGVGGFRFEIPEAMRIPGNHRVQFLSPSGRPHALAWRGKVTDTYEFDVPGPTGPANIVAPPAVTEDVFVNIDEISPQGVRGWAIDKTNPTKSPLIKWIVDGEHVTDVLCDLERPDVKSAGFPENLGFNFALERRFFDNKPHKVEVRTQSGGNLTMSVVGTQMDAYQLQQKWRPKVVSHIDGIREGVIKGWVFYEDPATLKRFGGANILVTCEGAHVAHIRANTYRPDVAKSYACPQECGFDFIPPPAFRRSRPQAFRFYLLPYEIELDGSPCITSFVGDAQQAAMSDVFDEFERLYRQMVAIRRKVRLIVPQPIFSIEDYDSWWSDYLIALRAGVSAQRHSNSRDQRSSNERSQSLVSIVCPTFRPNIAHFVQAVESVIAQTYETWELIIVDDGSQIPELSAQIEAFVRRDARIRQIKRAKNGGISAATNSGIKAARGSWIAFFDHDDLLIDVALEVMVTAADRTGAKVLYSDEDKIDDAGHLSEPAFKPDWNYRLLLTVNYVCHFLMVDKNSAKNAGSFIGKYDGAQDHAFLLRLSEVVKPEKIHHVPEVLYHWRKSESSTASDVGAKGYAIEAGIATISDHLNRLGKRANISSIGQNTWYSIEWSVTDAPTVTIVVPFKDAIEITRECVNRVLDGTDYLNYSVVLVDNWSVSQEAEDFCDEMRSMPNVRVIRVEEDFNYSRLNNLAVAQSNSEFIVLMNNDLFVTDPLWLRTIVSEALADEQVAIVGGKFLYPNGTVQHAGVVLGIGGVAAHVHTGLSVDDPGYGARALFAQEMSAVTAACMLIKSDVYRAVGGLDEEDLRVAFNDVDLCLKVRAAGWKVVWTPAFIAEHHESLSRGDDDQQPEKEARFFDEMHTMITRWGDTLKTDPFYSKHFSLDGRPFYDLVVPAKPKRVYIPHQAA